MEEESLLNAALGESWFAHFLKKINKQMVASKDPLDLNSSNNKVLFEMQQIYEKSKQAVLNFEY